MSGPKIPAGPFDLLKTATGDVFPYYIIPFDKEGTCVGPKTRDHLLKSSAEYSDIFFFSHGWNNDWTVATERYRSFIDGYQAQRKELGLDASEGYKPLLVGIFWPSQTMAWFESEAGPRIADHNPNRAVEEAHAAEALVSDIASEIPSDKKARFYELAQSDRLSKDEALELAQMLAALHAPDMEGLEAATLGAIDLLAAAASQQQVGTSQEPDYDQTGAVTTDESEPLDAAGGFLEKLDPRNIIKPFTVWQMKDRAGVVGSRGVSSLLEALLRTSTARLHLFGHSYGCKVVMHALSAIDNEKFVRQVHSVTLFQPAFSQYAFADALPGAPATKGGFYHALARVRGPVLATYSQNDSPLTKHFHLALRRESDLGELAAAAEGAEVPKFGALGGFGPQPLLTVPQPILDPGQPYDFGKGGRVLGIESTRKINGHGDISNPATWWLAYANVNSPYK